MSPSCDLKNNRFIYTNLHRYPCLRGDVQVCSTHRTTGTPKEYFCRKVQIFRLSSSPVADLDCFCALEGEVAPGSSVQTDEQIIGEQNLKSRATIAYTWLRRTPEKQLRYDLPCASRLITAPELVF